MKKDKDGLSAFDGWALFEISQRHKTKEIDDAEEIADLRLQLFDALEKVVDTMLLLNQTQEELEYIKEELARVSKELNDVLWVNART